MVYCDLIEATDSEGRYRFGFLSDDLSGEAVFYRDGTGEIKSLPKTGHGLATSVLSVAVKYRKDFTDGVFKQKISYECG